MERGYYAVIPASVRYDKNISPSAKLLYAEITALCNEKGFCWASNQYFMDLYGAGKTSVARWILELIDAGHILRNIQYSEDGKTVIQRCLSLPSGTTSPQNWGEGIPKNGTGGIPKNGTYNNTPMNTTSEYKQASRHVEDFYAVIDAYTNNPALIESLTEFIKMRIAKKKPPTNYALKLIFQKLNKLASSDEIKVEIINQSTLNGWQDVFELRQQKSQKTATENRNALLAEVIAEEERRKRNG